MQQVWVIKVVNVLTIGDCVPKRWNNFKVLMNEENEDRKKGGGIGYYGKG